jgi:hypothetical protein
MSVTFRFEDEFLPPPYWVMVRDGNDVCPFCAAVFPCWRNEPPCLNCRVLMHMECFEAWRDLTYLERDARHLQINCPLCYVDD